MQKKQLSQAKDHTGPFALLVEDHRKVQKMFEVFAKIKYQDDDERKQALVQRICAELTAHTQVEEEIFYPMAPDAMGDDDLFDEAEVEHASAKELIAKLEAMEPYDELYNARVTVLGEYVNHHIKEEEDEIFPAVKKARLDMQALSDELIARRKELLVALGVGGTDDIEDEDRQVVSQPTSIPTAREGGATRIR